MDDTAVETLSETEREILRALSITGANGTAARRLGRNQETVKQHLKSAREKLRVGSSKEAAAILAQAEGRCPTWGTPDQVIPHHPPPAETSDADPLPQVVRDIASLDWPSEIGAASPGGAPGGDGLAWLGKALWVAVSIVSLLAALTYVMVNADRFIAANTFQP